MTSVKRRFALALMVTLLATMFTSMALAKEGVGDTGGVDKEWREPEGRVEDEDIIFGTGIMTAKLEGTKPMIEFWYTHDYENMISFMVNFKDLIEYVDKNGDGVFDEEIDTAVNTLELEDAEFGHTGFYELSDVGTGKSIDRMGIGINITAVGPKEGLESTKVTFVLQMYAHNVTIEESLGAIAYTILGGSTLKVDVIIENWPFSDPANSLAVEVEVDKEITGVTTGGWDYDTTKADKGRIQFVNETGHIFGFFEWVNYSTVTPVDGDPYKVTVKAAYKIEELPTREGVLVIYLCYPNFKGTLEHDPTVGLIPAQAPPADIIPPAISLQQSPTTEISPSDSVTITAEVMDEYSGVKSVELMYSTDDGATWNPIELSPRDGKYSMAIPQQEEGTTVNYYVLATDVAGNQKVSDSATYTILAPSLDSWMLYGVALTAIIIAAVAYFAARR